MLAWLDDDREEAACKYETIRNRLIKIFINRGCCDAEDLADETITIVAGRVPDIRGDYVGEKVNYFCGVARKVYLKSTRKREIPTDSLDSLPTPPAERPDAVRECLRMCLDGLSSDQRELVLEYYLYEKPERIGHRKLMAKERALTANSLRLRAHHIRGGLEKCVRECVGV